MGGGLSRRAAFAVAFVLGLLAGLGQAPLNLFPLTVAALFLAYGLLSVRPGWRSALVLGWGLGAGYFALTLHWIVEPFFVDPWRHGWMSPFALFFVSTGFGMFWAGGFALARAVAPKRFLWLAWPIAMGFVELARAYVLTGFPWAMLSYVWVETPLIQLVSLIGSHGLTLVMLLLLGGFIRGTEAAAAGLASGASSAISGGRCCGPNTRRRGRRSGARSPGDPDCAAQCAAASEMGSGLCSGLF